MIISKDLFIFGEQIFATIIPEGGSSQGSQQQQQQQQQQLQQQQQQAQQPQQNQPPVNIINTAAITAAADVTVEGTVGGGGGGVAGSAAEQVVQVQVEPLKTTTVTTTTPAPTAAAAAATVIKTPTKTLTKQETVAVVVAAAAVAAAATAAAAATVKPKQKIKLQKMHTKETADEQVVREEEEDIHNRNKKLKEKEQRQKGTNTNHKNSSNSHHNNCSNNNNNNINSNSNDKRATKINSNNTNNNNNNNNNSSSNKKKTPVKEEEVEAETEINEKRKLPVPATTVKIQQNFAVHDTAVKNAVEVHKVVEEAAAAVAVAAKEHKAVVSEASEDDDEEEEEEADYSAAASAVAAAEKQPLVKRNTTKIIPTITTVGKANAATPEITFVLQQQQQQQMQYETLPLLQSKAFKYEQQQQQQQSLPPPIQDCHLQVEDDLAAAFKPPPLSINTAAAGAASSTIAGALTAASSPSSSATTQTPTTTTPSAEFLHTNVTPPDFTTINMPKQSSKVILSSHNNTTTATTATTTTTTSSDHAMVTFPFISEQHRTLQLTFQNINVIHNERKILSDVSGLVSPGEVLAIMGPSGCGKTTLLDCLSGQRRIDSGSIYLNREPVSKKWRRKICYVLQEEVFFSGLTLRETVMYTALLRLPEKMPKEEKVKLVDRILEALELTFCQQTKFGDYLNRGLSGGEKKRANIACELLTNPLLMLLDEPTSGLDSHSAISLMKVLKRCAIQEQKTVVITVHQPSSQMFHMFDKLLLLYNGRTAYFGEVNSIYRYFEDIGVAIKPHYNPADFVLEQLKSYPDIREKLFIAAKESHGNFLNRNCITVNTNNHTNHHHTHHLENHHNNQHQHPQHHNQNGITVTSTNGTTDAFTNPSNVIVTDKTHKHHDTLINDIINNYYKDIQSNHHSHHINHDATMPIMMATNHHHHHNNSCEEAAQQLWCGADSQSNFSSASSDFQQYECGIDDDWLDYPTRFHTQFRVLSSRNFKEAKPRMLSKLNWFQTIGLALMAGAIWFQIPRTEEFLHDLQGWMFFSQTYWMLFALFGALNSFPSEREVISKERRSGAYRLSAYYLAKMFGELPLVVTLPTVYLMISYPMLGCTSFKLFFLMLVFLLLNTIVAQSVGFFIGACCMDMNVSITLSALYTLATQLFGGYLSSRIPDGLSWIRYTSMIHYAYQNMQILEFREGPTIRCGNPSSYEICKNNTTTSIPYEEILKAQNSTSPLWLNTLILMMFFVVFRGLGYAVLRFMRCPKT